MSARLDNSSAVLGAAGRALRQRPELQSYTKLGEVPPSDFSALARATHVELIREGSTLSLAAVRQMLATSLASLASDRGRTAQSFLGAPEAAAAESTPGLPNAVQSFALDNLAKEKHAKLRSLVKQDLGAGARPAGVLARGWARSFGLTLSPETKRLLDFADRAGIMLELRSNKGAGTACFDAASNSVFLDFEALDAKFKAAGKHLSPERLLNEILGHELIHGVIHDRVPQFDYLAHKAIPRAQFNEGLETILSRLDARKAEGRAAEILKIIQNTDPLNRPEEVVTYALTDPDFQKFVRREGQLAPLKGHLRRYAMGDLVPSP